MIERSLAQSLYEAWEAANGRVSMWLHIPPDVQDKWKAVAAACASVAEAEVANFRDDRKRLMVEADAAQSTIADLRAVSDVLRTQLAEATDEAATLRLQLADVSERLRTVEEQALGYEAERDAALRELDEHEDIESLRDRLAKADEKLRLVAADRAEWAHKCGKAQAEARELREGRATWVVGGDGTRQLVFHRVVGEQVGTVQLGIGGHVDWTVKHGGVVAEGSCDPRSSTDQEQAMCRAQRIVEAVAGVRP